MTLDGTDREIIALLREDGRMKLVELARRLGMARSTALARLERLERTGIIRGYTVLLAEDYDRAQIRAHVSLTIGPKALAGVEAALRRMRGVRQLYSVSGTVDLIALCQAESVAEMDKLIDRIGLVEGVQRTTSSVLLSTRISR